MEVATATIIVLIMKLLSFGCLVVKLIVEKSFEEVEEQRETESLGTKGVAKAQKIELINEVLQRWDCSWG